MKKYKCPKCKTTAHVVKFGYRKKVHRFFCKKCRKHFSFNPCFLDRKAVLNDHLDSLSFRKLVLKYKFSPQKKNELFEQKLALLEKKSQIKKKGNCWLEPMEEFVDCAIKVRKIGRVKNSCHDLGIMAKKVGSNFFLKIVSFQQFLISPLKFYLQKRTQPAPC
jgi:hypothetical protein